MIDQFLDLKWVPIGHRGRRSGSSAELVRLQLAEDHFDSAPNKCVKLADGETKVYWSIQERWETELRCEEQMVASGCTVEWDVAGSAPRVINTILVGCVQ